MKTLDSPALVDDPVQEFALSSLVRKPSTYLASGLSRRSVIARFFGIALSIVGIQTLYAIVGAPHATATSHCTPCYWCGLCGIPCSVCGDPPSPTQCPSGTSRGANAWCACCPCGTCRTYCYYDCCGSASCSQGSCSNNCGPWIDVWCTGNYVCTVLVDSGSCGPC